ncbi:DUF3168 domain-containing protein [Rhizobium laguerreae]|uniref:DUF3168 domain-containing protein n=1 Tax=Rhizobium laguerreae TaxID=1076926 RepID=UPI00143F7DE4|nr:DUF3168 domain-containing protein [Rhizobium laguerreae]NKM86344.1 DUF3168 domain-containing protein [Rhizobium laguerreae]
MSEPSLDLQKAVRARLLATSAVIAIVPAGSIADRSGTPATFPSILIGEGQTTPGGDIARRRHEVFADLHVWTEEPGLAVCKQIAGAVRSALADGRWSFDHFEVADLYISSSRFMRDPDGKHGHSVISLSAIVLEVA